MTGSGDPSARDPLDLLVEQFLQQRRAGAPSDVEAFAAAHPAHAEALRDLLPTLLALEEMKRDRESSGSGRRASVPKLDRLGDFRIVGELGRGGMGVVFEAEQESLGRKVALKVLPQAGLLTGNQLERFRREAQIAAQLHHSNIVPVFGSGESDGYHWYAMQFIVGRSLDRWRDEQALSPPFGSGPWRDRGRLVARLGQQAASALHYAHGLGTLHRDIKPANLLLEHNDHLWVTDFGLAKALEAEGLTQTGDLLGTLQYMAPEQFTGSYDVRSEVYALGVTLYEMLTLRPAFAGSSRSELMERIRTQRPASLQRTCPELPDDLVVVVEKAMARDPADRYRDAEAMARDLQAFLDDRPIEARRLSTARMVWRWCRRNRAMATLAASTFVAVVGAGITGWVAYGVAGEEGRKAELAAIAEAQQKQRAETNLAITLTAFGEVFDSLVGRDPALAVEEDEDTGEQSVVVRTAVDPRHVELLHRMLAFYGQFATENADNQVLQLETARASRRVGSIHARLGKPDDLEAAGKAFAQSLQRYATVTDRDVGREVAAVHVQIGQLQQRRLRPGEAESSFQQALDLLAALQNTEAKSVRSERAAVLLLAAQNLLPRGRLGDGVRRAPPGLESRLVEGERERVRRAGDLLQAGVTLVESLLAEAPADLEYQAIRARCHLTAARLAGRRADGGRGRPEPERAAAETVRSQQLRAGVDLLRQVVLQAPAHPTYAVEFVEALLEAMPRRDAGRGDPGSGGPGPGRERERDPDDIATRRVLLHEAMTHAEALCAQQPDLVEYRALVARVGSEYGATLRDAASLVAGGERQALLRQAESALLAAATLENDLVADPAVATPRHLVQACGTRRELGSLYLAQERRDEALQQARLVVELLEGLFAALAPEPAATLPMPLVQLLRQRQVLGIEDLLRRLQEPVLSQRLRVLLQRLPRSDGDDRPPGEPRRR